MLIDFEVEMKKLHHRKYYRHPLGTHRRHQLIGTLAHFVQFSLESVAKFKELISLIELIVNFFKHLHWLLAQEMSCCQNKAIDFEKKPFLG